MKKQALIFYILISSLFIVSCNLTEIKNPPLDVNASIPTVSQTSQTAASMTTLQTASAIPPTPLSVQETNNLPYTSERKLDVDAPIGSVPWPVMIVLHGLGDFKEMIAPLSYAIAERGAVAFTPNWRYSEIDSADKIPGQAEDVACTVRFVRKNASSYHGDPTRLVVVGHSGGAVMGAVITLAGDDFHEDCLVNEGSALPDGFVGLDGGYDNLGGIEEAKLKEFSPQRWAVISPFDYIFIDRRPSRRDVQFDLMVGTAVPS